MPLQPGTRLGDYEVVSALGVGGMGEVYRARDLKLGREVAIKMLLDEVASDPDRLARFDREARALASLNHTNIATLFGFFSATAVPAAGRERSTESPQADSPESSTEDSTSFLAMELVEGETLAELISRGPISLDDALPILTQIGEGLSAAHDSGIVHRDLKPANIKITPDGHVKILDFGLAKALGPDVASGEVASSLSPTLTLAATQRGEILGTAAYMSPEQARGRPIDKRTDVWAFGVILWEMLTGRQLFGGETLSDTIAAVLREPIDTDQAPVQVRRALEVCLERDPRRRLRDIGDVWLLLEERSDGGSEAALPPAGSLGWLWPTLAAAGFAAAAILAVLHFRQRPPDPPPPISFTLNHPGLETPAHEISPDGSRLAFFVRSDVGAVTALGGRELWLRSMASVEANPVPGAVDIRGQSGVVWSPDSRSLLYHSRTGLQRIDLAAGQVMTILGSETIGSSASVSLGAWSRSGTIVYGVSYRFDESGSWAVADTGGAPRQITVVDEFGGLHVPSAFLPDDRRFLYFVTSLPGTTFVTGGHVRIGSLDIAPDQQDPTPLLDATSPARYVPDSETDPHHGRLLFLRGNALFAQRFDAAAGTLAGEPQLLVSDVGNPQFSASHTGAVAYRTDSSVIASELVRIDRTGRRVGVVGPRSNYISVVAFPDGRRVTTSRAEGADPSHVYVVDLDRGVFSRLNPGARQDYAGTPSPDDTIAFTYSPEGPAGDIWVRAANGVGDAARLVGSDTVKHPNDWTPDGRYLIYDDHRPGMAQDLFIVSRDGGEPVPFLATAADETMANFSPDGEWVAYASTESGTFEIYVRDFAPDRVPAYGTEKVQISVRGGDKPRWSPDGREIYYLAPDGMLMATAVTPGRPFRVGDPEPLFKVDGKGYVPYDVLAGGDFVVNSLVEDGETEVTPIVVLLNWPSLLADGSR